ncbi:MAG: primosomal protein N', partial [Oscillospiraceae bacterium]|nr:primosomal protein N' [Oscillospiraceae bacterium]
MQIVKVAVSAASFAIDKPYDYLAPEPVMPGQRVMVPFGRGNRLCEAMVLSVASGVPDHPIKAIAQLLDEEPVIDEKGIRLALWMRQRYYCSFYDALHVILPA